MLKRILKGSALAGMGVVTASLIEYAYYLSMANMLGPAQFGLLSTALSVMWIIVTLLTASIGLSIAKFISEDGSMKKVRGLVFNGIALGFLSTIAASAILYTIASFVLPKTGVADLRIPLTLVGLVMPVLSLTVITATIFQGLNRMGGYSRILVLNSGIKVGLSAYLVYIGYGLYGAIGGYAVGAVVSTAYGLKVLGKYVDFRQKIDRKLLEKIALFSMPVAALTIVTHILLKSDVVFLKFFGATNELIGYYTGAALIARFVYFSSSSIAIAALPVISKKKTLKWSEIRKPIAVILFAFIAGNTIITLFSGQIITLFFPQKYASVSHLLPPLAFAMSLLSLGYIASTALIAQGRPKDTLKPLSIGLIAYVILMTYLTPKTGLNATYTSLICGGGLYLALTLAENKKHIK